MDDGLERREDGLRVERGKDGRAVRVEREDADVARVGVVDERAAVGEPARLRGDGRIGGGRHRHERGASGRRAPRKMNG